MTYEIENVSLPLILDAKILIVDDDLGNLRILERLLKKVGYREILTAQSGEEGIESYLRERPDLVLLDLKMPFLSGLDVMREIREKQSLSPELKSAMDQALKGFIQEALAV